MALDIARWSQLSPLLDELLDLAAPARAVRLQALRAEDSSLADDLAELLRRDVADFPPSPMLTPTLHAPQAAGQTVGAYTLVREIGQGGMGTVWLARRTDGRFEGQVAIKFLNAALLGRGGSVRFAREGQILAKLAHPHIARLIDAGVAADGGSPYLVLDYVDGVPVTDYCEQQQLDVRARLTLFLDVLGAVAHAHNRLILHRDLKPSNILVNAAGEVKLLDFGIAKLLTDASSTIDEATVVELTKQVGNAYTPNYAAPEQLQGGEVTTATDVYALGVLLYLLLSGAHPMAAALTGTPLERLRAVVETEPKRLSDQVRTADPKRARELHGDLDTIVARALKKAPAERYANAAALADDVRRWLAHEPIAARPDSAAYRLAKFVRRHRLGVAAGGVAALALSMLTLLSLAQAWRAERAEKLAQQRSAQADDLLGFMLGEFADKLRPIGRLELLASVGSKAIAHLSESPNVNSPSAASAHSILQRAKALTVLGEVSVAKRELDAALTPLQAARRLLAADPPATAHEHANAALLADWRKAQGTAAFWVGHAYYTKRQFAPARAAWDDYEHYSRQWLLAAPGQFEPTVELSYALSNLGTLLMDEGHLSEAAERFRASIALKQQALALKPLDLPLQAELANSLSLLGTALLWQGEFQPAQALFEQGLQAIVSARQQAPRDLEWAYREAAMRQWLGQAALKLDDRARARSAFQAVIAVTQSLLQQEPKNRRWWQLQARAEVALANLQAPSPADTRHLQELMAELDALDAGSGGAAATRRLPLRAQASLGLSRQLQAQQQTPAAIDTLTQTLALLRAAANRQPEDLPLQVESGAVRLALSALYEQTHDRLAAQTQCIAVEQELRDLRPLLRLHHEITRLWVQAHSCLNQAGQVQQEQSWLQQRGKPSV